MTSIDLAPARLSISAISSLAVGAVVLALHLTVRLFSGFAWNGMNNGGFDPGVILGVLGLLSILPILGAIALGHVGFLATRPGGKRGRTRAVIGLTLGYVLFVLYLNRLGVDLIWATQTGQWGDLVTNFFWWA